MYKFLKFEWKHWLKTPMLWIFLLINTLLIFGATTSDNIIIGGGVGNVWKNSPYVVQQYYLVMSLIALLMTTAFMTATAGRDFSTGMYQFVFSSPIRKRDYFFGKFFGAALIAAIPLLGVSLGTLLGPFMPWVSPERYGEVVWSGHLQGFLLFALPNTLITAVVVFGLAVLFRSNLVSYVGSMLLLVLYVVSQGYTSDLDKEWLAILLDPFGLQPFSLASKYLTVQEKNTAAVPLTMGLWVNRLLWLGLAFLALLGIYHRFSFSEKNKKGASAESEAELAFSKPVKAFQPRKTVRYSVAILWNLMVFETKTLLKNQSFLILVSIGLINLVASLTSFSDIYGSKSYPVTYSIIDTIRGSFFLFLLGFITFYSGLLVWKERDARMAEIEDATAIPNGFRFVSRLSALLAGIFAVLCGTILAGILVQTMNGYFRFEIGQYVMSLLVFDFLDFAWLAVMALFFQHLIQHRYIAYFAFVVFLVLNSFVWSALKVESNMVIFGATPFMIFSDMNGFGPFLSGKIWFSGYWTLIAALIAVISHGFSMRGKETGFASRSRQAWSRIRQNALPVALLAGVTLLCGAFVFYNTQVENTYQNGDETEADQQAYELTYKKFEGIPQPSWVALDYDIDLYPYDRNLYVSIKGELVNKTTSPIPELHFTLPPAMDSVDILIPGAKLRHRNERLVYRIFRLSEPLQPGDTISISIRVKKETKGFENEVSFTSVTQNGTFFNNADILPGIGYQRNFEISDRNKRKKLGLPPRQRSAPLDEHNMDARSRTYLGLNADYVDVRTVVRTTSDQIAVAPGSLRREWREGDRRCFEYQLDRPSLNFYSFISARYQVARKKWNGIDLEVYHIPEHAYNVPNMISSMQKSLEYYTRNFGPYYHKQCRIIEFPRYASFAQAFPGTMPYSEGIGFIADLREVEADDIDFVFFVVAHEMAHQYWAHQMAGADMRGAEMLSESFAEYSALMVMEKAYGKDKMKKFLAYEMDDYLNGRSNELEAERPLMESERQAYIHYHKGSVALYYLKEMIGEAQMSRAFQKLLGQYAYREAPYATSLDAVRAFREVTPDSLQYVIDDLFEHITLFSNRVVEAEATKSGDAWKVTIKTQMEKFRADSLGRETAVPLKDYVDIGIFADSDSFPEPGRPLLMQRMKITGKEDTFTFEVKEKPDRAGIDPYLFLIDRIPDDNVKKVALDNR